MSDSESIGETCITALMFFGVIFLIGAIPYCIVSVAYPDSPSETNSEMVETASENTSYRETSESVSKDPAGRSAGRFDDKSTGYDWQSASDSYKFEYCNLMARANRELAPGITGQDIYDSLSEFYDSGDDDILRQNIIQMVALTVTVYGKWDTILEKNRLNPNKEKKAETDPNLWRRIYEINVSNVQYSVKWAHEAFMAVEPRRIRRKSRALFLRLSEVPSAVKPHTRICEESVE